MTHTLPRELNAQGVPEDPADPLATADMATASMPLGNTLQVQPGRIAEQLPRRFGEYELLEQLGEGGMGVVYKARQVTADRLVALKLVRPDQLASHTLEDREKVLARFHNEVQAAARLEHDHVVTVYDVGEIGGQSYYAMRLVEGESLKDRLAKGPLEPDVAARYMEQVARAVAEAHSQGILHRDLKPHNVMIDRRTDRALLTDFGLAKLAQQDQELTAHGAVFGSPPYMSPEQTIDAGNVTAASDIYGLGATLYHLLTGRPPFHAANVMATLQQVQTAEPTSPRVLNPAVPLDLETVCLKCLEKTPARRFASAAELADRLAKIQHGEPIPERPLSRPAKVWRWCKRNRTVATLAGGMTLLIVAIAVVSPIVAIQQYKMAGELEKSLNETTHARAAETQALKSQQDSMLKLLVSKDRNSDPNIRLRPGWKQAELEQLGAGLPKTADDVYRLAFNSIAADYLTATDLVHVADLAIGEPMNCLAFDTAGKYLAMARHMGIPGGLVTSVQVYDVNSQAQRHEFEFHSFNPLNPNGARSIAFSPEGRWLVVGDRHGTVHYWDLTLKEPQHSSFPAHGSHSVTQAAFSSAGDLYTCGGDRTLRRWSLLTVEQPGAFRAAGQVEFDWPDPRFTLLPDGEVLVSEKEPRILDAKTFEPRPDSEPDEAWRSGLSRSAAVGRARALALVVGQRVLLVDRDTRRLWHAFVDPRATAASRTDAQIEQIAASATGSLLATADSQGYVQVWNVVSGRLISELPAGSPRSNAVAISPDGQYLAMTSASDNKHLVSLWRVSGPEVHRSLAISPDMIRDFRPLANGDLAVFTAKWRDGRMSVDLVRPAQDEWLRRLYTKVDFEGPPSVLAIDPTGPSLLHTGTGRDLFSWNTRTGKTQKSVDVSDLRLLEYSPDGACWAVRGSNELGFYDINTGFQPRWNNAVSKVLTGRGGLTALAAGRKYVAVAGEDGSVVLFRREGAADLKELPRINGGGPVTSVILNPSEETLIFGTQGGKLGLVRLASGGEAKFIEAHAGRVEALAFTSNGRSLVSASDDQQILIWRVNDAGALRQSLALRPQLGPFAKVRFSPDDKQLYALAKGSFSVHVWDLGQLEAEFRSTFGQGLMTR